MVKINWLEVVQSILTGETTINNLHFTYIIVGDESSRIGYMIVWEPKSRRAHKVSNMHIPENVGFVSSDDEILDSIIPEDLVYEAI